MISLNEFLTFEHESEHVLAQNLAQNLTDKKIPISNDY